MGSQSRKPAATVSTAKNQPVTTVTMEYYQLIIGFEVNYPKAFVNGTQILDIDYGHAFFYLTKNGIVKKFFSFGPRTGGKKNKTYAHRLGNSLYAISEMTRLFKFSLSKQEFDVIAKETDKISAEINSGRQKYTAMVNDTCAETARDIIVKGFKSVPEGTGPVDAVGWAPNISAVNPYKWHHNMVSAGLKQNVLIANSQGWDTVMSKFTIKVIKDPTISVFPNINGDYE